MRIYLSLLTLLVFICVQLPISAQNQGNRGKRVSLLRSPKTRAMAAAFKSGKLPEPLRLPTGSIDQQAVALAKAVAAGDDSSTAALYAAILASGYAVRDADGSLMQTTENGQGLIFESHEVAATAKLYGEDYGVMLGHLGEAFSRSVPELKDIPLATALLEGIRNGAKSNHPAVRFSARFIIELGKKSGAPYDLLEQVDPTKTRLDAVQMALILKRLSGDLAAVTKQKVGRLGRPIDRHSHHANPPSACGATEAEDVINDFNALSRTTLFGIIMDRIGGAAASYAKAAGIANAVLTVFKFLVSYASVEVEITMDGDELVRTKTTRDGEKRTLTAKLRMDTEKWKMVNCLRPELNKAGLDVDIPQNGPLAGVKVNWVLIAGGDSRGRMGVVEDFIDIITLQEPTGDGIVYLDAVGQTSPDDQYTNSEGVSEIDVVGIRQKTDLSRRKLFEVFKAAGVRVDVQLKSMRITDQTQAISNVMDIAGNAFSFLTKDSLGGAIGTAAETMYRSNWYGAKSFYFPVKDWEPCQGHWLGTITYKVFSKKEGSAENIANKSSWKDQFYYEARAQIDGRMDHNAKPLARVDAHVSETRYRESIGKSRPCHGESKQTRDLSGKATEIRSAIGVVTLNPRSGEYSVSAPTILVTASGESTLTSVIVGTCNNPFNKGVNEANKEEGHKFDVGGPYLQGKGRIDPANPDAISGSDSVTVQLIGGVEKTVTITWDLKRCADQ